MTTRGDMIDSQLSQLQAAEVRLGRAVDVQAHDPLVTLSGLGCPATFWTTPRSSQRWAATREQASAAAVDALSRSTGKL